MTTSPRQVVREMYNTSSDWYADIMDSEIQLPIYADVLARFAQRVAKLPGAVVDTSCGTGHMLGRYQDEFDPGRRLVGVDLAPAMVEFARSKLTTNSELLVGDMCHLPQLESGTAAGVISYFSLHHVSPEDGRKALKEWQRILAPNGQLLLAAWEGNGEIDYGESFDINASLYSQAELESWVTAAGFQITRSAVKEVEDMGMKALYLEAIKG